MKKAIFLALMEQLIDTGDCIREKLDKRGYHGGLSAQDMYDYWIRGNKERTLAEVIEPMKQFITLFEELDRKTK